MSKAMSDYDFIKMEKVKNILTQNIVINLTYAIVTVIYFVFAKYSVFIFFNLQKILNRSKSKTVHMYNLSEIFFYCSKYSSNSCAFCNS